MRSHVLPLRKNLIGQSGKHPHTIHRLALFPVLSTSVRSHPENHWRENTDINFCCVSLTPWQPSTEVPCTISLVPRLCRRREMFLSSHVAWVFLTRPQGTYKKFGLGTSNEREWVYLLSNIRNYQYFKFSINGYTCRLVINFSSHDL